MFNNESVNITAPNGPYSRCTKEDCDGIMFPIIEPARAYSEMYESWVKGTAVLFWKCSKCNVIIR